MWLGWSRWRSVIHGSWIMGLVGDGDGDGDGWVWLKRAGFFWVWSGWVEIGGWGGCFCWRMLGFSGFDQGGDWWSFLYCLVDRDSDWALTRWIRFC